MTEQNGATMSEPRALAQDVGEFAHDLVILMELQAELLVADMKECSQRLLVPALALVCGVAFALACFPIALTALALLLIQKFEVSYAAGFLIATGVGVVLSALACVAGWFQIRDRVVVLRRSQQELARNIRWVKNVLKRTRITRRQNVDNSWRTTR